MSKMLRATLRLAVPVMAAILGLVATVPAQASPTGSLGWSITDLPISRGPGAEYQALGTIPAGVRLIVERCQRSWCLVTSDGQEGWTALGRISFGQEARGPLSGPHFPSETGSQACLYEGTNYTGAELCIPNGKVYNDLLVNGLDNRFSSIKIEGEGSVTLCRDRNFQSYCSRLSESAPVLPELLNNAVSSVHVW